MAILLVEDDVASRDLLAEVLTGRGYCVHTASNGSEALAKMEGGAAPQMLILDLMMPDMNGYQLRAEMLRRSDLADIPVVIVSATLDPDHSADLAALALLPKPVDVSKLCDVIRAAAEPAFSH